MNRKLLYGLALLVASGGGRSALGWQPAKGPLETRWTHEVSPKNVWPEYPRPQMVRKNWTSLNGLWQYAIRPAGEVKPEKWDGEILVPFAVESALSGVKKPVQPDQRLWYRRTFSWHTVTPDQLLLLHFGAVDWKCTVWVNDKKIGEHTGGYDPFTFDITDAIHPGDNELVVGVSDPTDTGTQPHGKQSLHPRGIWYTAVTGIWQTVWLEPAPKLHIESFEIVPNVDGKKVAVTVRATGDGSVQLRAIDSARDRQRLEAIVAKGCGKAGSPIELSLPNAILWSPDRPYLYGLQVDLLDGEKVVDSVRSYFGMRKIEVKKDANGINRLWLNNKVLFQFGPLDQGWWPDGLYTAPADAALKYDIEMTKRLGMNMARKHGKVEPDRWYYWCDKLGLLVWQDMPSGDRHIRPNEPDIERSAASASEYEREWSVIIGSRRNHPSIVMWVPFNEGWGQFDTARIVELTHRLDPTRLVDATSGWADRGVGDVHDMHKYPGPGMPKLEEKRAAVLGEFGGLGMPIRGHTWQQEKNWGYVSYKDAGKLTDAYVGLLTALRPLIDRGLAAAVYTQTTDVEVEVNGMMTYDRNVLKMDESRITAAAEKIYSLPLEGSPQH
ncbi:MAG TPA: glycoside hydrolase family 2 TIM barrel-domain containing protein [Lacipirellulaceae bacterium]|nr:glycoside hydrolase family 2 TIM barrel-domain containing protein [Lacipirellulaceae bacterium]